MGELPERGKARAARRGARADIARRVRALHAELGDANAVAARIDSDPALSTEEGAASLREALRQRP